jgi:hypothetical protein
MSRYIHINEEYYGSEGVLYNHEANVTCPKNKVSPTQPKELNKVMRQGTMMPKQINLPNFKLKHIHLGRIFFSVHVAAPAPMIDIKSCAACLVAQSLKERSFVVVLLRDIYTGNMRGCSLPYWTTRTNAEGM